jgi:hypothetical protein
MENDILAKMQETEITEYYIYKTLASWEKNEKNRDIFLKISQDELSHYNTLNLINSRYFFIFFLLKFLVLLLFLNLWKKEKIKL